MRRKLLIADVAAGQPNKLLTLTTRRIEGGDPIAEARRQGEALHMLILWIKRSFPGAEVHYFVVREATKKGWPHLHVALRAPFIHHKKLRRWWLKLTGSPGVDIRQVHSGKGAARYIAKYIGKDLHQFGTCKRYWSSRGWLGARVEAERDLKGWNSKWHVVRETIGVLRERYWLRRWDTFSNGSLHFFEAHAPPAGGRHG